MFHLNARMLPAILLAGSALVGPGVAQAATRNYIVTDFDSVRLEAPIAVAVQTHHSTTAHAEGDRDMLNRIDLQVTDNVLTIRLKPSPFEGRRSSSANDVRLFLTTRSLRRLQLYGAGTLAADGMAPQASEISSSGAGTLHVANLDSDKLSVSQLGAGVMTLSGKARDLTVHVTGNGTLDAEGLTASDLDLTSEGAASVNMTAKRSAKITAIGSGSVTVDGNPACTVRHAGSGTVTCAGADY